MASALPINVTCPVCGTPFVARIQNIVDVGRQPELKRELLQGQVNIAACPKCGQRGVLATPLLYHDPEKEQLLVFVPDQLNMQVKEREKIIGSLVNALISTVPAEQRKAYLLQPKTFFALERLMEEILQADGITKEMIEAQRQKINLIQELLAAKDNADSLKALVEQGRDKLDYEFFLLLSASIDAANQEGEARRVGQLLDLRERLLELIAPPIPEPLPAGATRQDLIEKLLNAENKEALEGLVISNHQMVDYLFFQALTERIEALENAGDTAQAARLRDLRGEVLDVTDRLDKEVRAAQQETVALISELLASQDLDKAVTEHPEGYDALFFIILGSMMESANKMGQKDLADKLQDLRQRVVAFLEQQMPPELRLINQLLAAEYPEGTKKLLQEQADQVTEDLVAAMRAIASDLETRQPRMARRLRDIAEQAVSLLTPTTKQA